MDKLNKTKQSHNTGNKLLTQRGKGWGMVKIGEGDSKYKLPAIKEVIGMKYTA